MNITVNMVGQGPRTHEFMRSETFEPCSWYGTREHQKDGKDGCVECRQRERLGPAQWISWQS